MTLAGITGRGVWCLLALLAPCTALAMELIAIEDECRGRQLVLTGTIEPGDYERFVARMSRLVTRETLPAVQDAELLWTLKLDSPGGDLGEAMRIGRFLRAALAITEVGFRFAPRPDGVWDLAPDGTVVCLGGDDRLAGCAEGFVQAQCTGACLLIWVGGAERYAHEGRLGLHGLAGNAAVVDYLVDMGASRVLAQLDNPPPGGGWLSWRERHELSTRSAELGDLLAGCPEPLTAQESFDSVTRAPGPAQDALLDRADAHRACRRERLAGVRATLLTAES